MFWLCRFKNQEDKQALLNLTRVNKLGLGWRILNGLLAPKAKKYWISIKCKISKRLGLQLCWAQSRVRGITLRRRNGSRNDWGVSVPRKRVCRSSQLVLRGHSSWRRQKCRRLLMNTQDGWLSIRKGRQTTSIGICQDLICKRTILPRAAKNKTQTSEYYSWSFTSQDKTIKSFKDQSMECLKDKEQSTCMLKTWRSRCAILMAAKIAKIFQAISSRFTTTQESMIMSRSNHLGFTTRRKINKGMSRMIATSTAAKRGSNGTDWGHSMTSQTDLTSLQITMSANEEAVDRAPPKQPLWCSE